MSKTKILKGKESEDVQIKVREYIESKWKQSGPYFSNCNWLKAYLKETVDTELDLVDKFFSGTEYTYSIQSKWACVARMTNILRTLFKHQDSQLLSEIHIQSSITDEKNMLNFSLSTFLFQDLIDIIIDYSLGIRLTVDMYIDVMDANNEWDVGEVQKILRYKNNVYMLIHYVAFDNYYDEFINAKSDRIRFLYNDKNQIVCKWQKVTTKEGLPLDYRLRFQSKWNTATADEVPRNIEVVLAPAGTFVTR